MRKSLIRLSPIFVGLLILLGHSVTMAQSTRTWVSGVGDDASPCSRTAPCKTFAGALNNTARGGEINCLDSGGFGAATITKSITIDGTAAHASILAPSVTAISINITSAADASKTVRLRRLSLNGVGEGVNGVNIVSARQVFLDEILIDGFEHGVLAQAERTEVFINNTVIRHAGKAGINIAPTGTAARVTLFLERTTLMANFNAVSVQKGGRATIRSSSMSENRNGIIADGSEVSAIDCVLTENESAITARDRSTVRLSEVAIIHNRRGLLITGGKIIAFNHVLINGNDTDGAPTATVPTP